MLFFPFLFLYACKVSHINHSIKRIFPKRRWEIPYSCFFIYSKQWFFGILCLYLPYINN